MFKLECTVRFVAIGLIVKTFCKKWNVIMFNRREYRRCYKRL